MPVDLPPEPEAPALSQPAAYEARANERVALRSQIVRLEGQHAEAVAARDRAIARKAVDGSEAARAASDAAIGAVIRIEAELDGVRSALARLTAQAEANAEASALNKAAAQVKAAAQTAQDMLALAGEADAALTAFVAAHRALGEKLAVLHGLAPSRFHDGLFGGGNGLTQALLATAAKNQLAAGGIVPRAAFPNPIAATLIAAVEHFTKPLIEEAAGLQPAPVDRD
ncbi:MAG: hypothetical protein C0524_06090 [Rhodobacter sp.]|nr:hypothetical protein [Rhodobacter sp.]